MTLNKKDQEILERYLARRASWDAKPITESSAELEPDAPEPISVASGDSRIAKQGDEYVISNVTLYAPNGQPARSYSQVFLDANPVAENGSIVTKTQPDWLSHYQGTNKQLPSLPLFYAILEAVYDHQGETVAKELKTSLEVDFKDNWITTGTRINYADKKVWHDVTLPNELELQADITEGAHYLDQLVTDATWATPLQALFMTQNLQKIPQVMGMYTSRRGRLWTPIDSRDVDRAAFVGFINVNFSVDGGLSLSYSGRSRGVGTGGAP